MTGRPLSRQLALAWGAVTLAGAAWLPSVGARVGHLPACPFRSVTGWPCAACGSGHALAALAGGDVVAALAANPLAATALVGFGVAGVAALVGELTGRPLVEPRVLPAWVRVGLPLALVADWLYLAWALS